MTTVILYLSVFLISIFLCWQMNKSFRVMTDGKLQIKGVILLFFEVIIICLPICIISAFRSDTVGVDTKTYVGLLNEARKFGSFVSFYNYKNGEDWLFSLLIYISARISQGRFLYLGMLQLLTVFPIMILAIRHVKDIPTYKTLSVYYFWFFTDSMNASRQYVAISFLLLMYDHLLKKEYKQAVLCFIIGFGFHSSSLIAGVSLLFLYLIVKSKQSSLKKILLFIVMILMLIYGQKIFLDLYSIGLFPRRWSLYINTFVYRDSSLTERWQYLRIGIIVEIAVRLFIIMFLFLSQKKQKNNGKEVKNYLVIYIIGILVYSWGILFYHTEYFVRLSVYFDFFVILILPEIDDKVIRLKFRNSEVPFFTVIVSFLYWILHAVIMNSGKAFPYAFYR